MNLLLDTHTLLWWLAGNPALSERAREAIQRETGSVVVSAATAWEIATKGRIGKPPDAEWIAAELPALLQKQGFRSLPVTLDHALSAGGLPGPHRDPFDRMLMAQARFETLRVVTRDPVFAAYGIDVFW